MLRNQPKLTKVQRLFARRYRTLAAMASDTGISESYLTKIGRGYPVAVSGLVVSKLARALGRTEDHIRTIIFDAQRVARKRSRAA